MFGTLLSLLIVAMIFFLPFPLDSSFLQDGSLFFFSAVPIILFVAQLFLTAFAFRPLQKSEQNLTPRIVELFKKRLPF